MSQHDPCPRKRQYLVSRIPQRRVFTVHTQSTGLVPHGSHIIISMLFGHSLSVHCSAPGNWPIRTLGRRGDSPWAQSCVLIGQGRSANFWGRGAGGRIKRHSRTHKPPLFVCMLCRRHHTDGSNRRVPNTDTTE